MFGLVHLHQASVDPTSFFTSKKISIYNNRVSNMVIARALKDQQYFSIIEVVLCEDSIARPQREWHDMTHPNEVRTGAAAMKWKTPKAPSF